VNKAPVGRWVVPDLGGLSALAPQLAQTFVSMASDIALVMDGDGTIRHVTQGDTPVIDTAQDWVGRRWIDTVSLDTRPKVDLLLTEVQTTGMTQRREVNHPLAGGSDVPVAYAAIRLGESGPVLAVGRDLRTIAALQQRFIDAQQQMERDYWQQRQAESRYRMLFQVATDAVLVVHAKTLRIVEANRAAGALLGCASEDLVGQHAAQRLARTAQPGVEELLLMAQATGRPAEVRVRAATMEGLAPLFGAIDVSATPFRSDTTPLLLVRARSVSSIDDLPAASGRLSRFVARTPDAVVITDALGRVQVANPAFLSLCERPGPGPGDSIPLTSEVTDGLRGRALTDLLGDAQQAVSRLLSETRRVGIVEQHRITVGADPAWEVAVEASAALLSDGGQDGIGLTFRRLEQRSGVVSPAVDALAASIDRLASQLGLVLLPDLLQEASDLTERHLIMAALARTEHEHLQAAQLLGISAEALWERIVYHGLTECGLASSAAAKRLN
jgi:transcriptional regulator PpsR